jgi:hypothetical protein
MAPGTFREMCTMSDLVDSIAAVIAAASDRARAGSRPGITIRFPRGGMFGGCRNR